MSGQQVSQPVAQVVAGFSKVFVGEIIEAGQSAPETSLVHWPFANFVTRLSATGSKTSWRVRSTVTGSPS